MDRQTNQLHNNIVAYKRKYKILYPKNKRTQYAHPIIALFCVKAVFYA